MDFERFGMQVTILSEQGNELVGYRLQRSDSQASRIAGVLLHGAGLEATAPLYRQLGQELCETMDMYLVGLRASGFINYNQGFRKPLGWAHHDCPQALQDYQA